MPLIMVNHYRALIVEIVMQLVEKLVFVALEVQRLAIWDKNVSRNKPFLKEVVCEEVKLWSIEVDDKVRHSMAQSELLSKISLRFHQSIELVDTL